MNGLKIKKYQLLILFLILGVLLPQKFHGQSNDTESYLVIKGYFTHLKDPYILDIKPQGFQPKGISFDEVLNRKIYVHNPHMEVNIDSVFNGEDFSIMKQQLLKLKNISRFDKEMLTSHHIPYLDSKKELPNNFRILEMTFPLFSKDRQVALLYVEHAEEGIGGGEVTVLKQKNENWCVLFTIPIWTN